MLSIILIGSSEYCGETTLKFNDSAMEDTRTEIRRIAYQIVAPVTVVTGILGNILTLFVLITKPFIKGGTRIYLTALATSDLIMMVTVIPMAVRWNDLEWKTFTSAFYYAHLELFLNNTFIASSVFIVVCLTVERYFSVCLPTMFRSVHSVKIARQAILGCYVLATLVSAPLTILKTSCVHNKTEPEEWGFHENNNITDTIYWKVYIGFSEFIVRLGPCLVLAVLNILIIRRFRKITAKRKIFREALIRTRNRNLFDNVNSEKIKKALRNKKYQEEKRLMVLLRSIVILFFVTMTPSSILSLIYSDGLETTFEYLIFRATANNLELANFALNFYIYFFCSKEFRSALVSLCTSCDMRVDENNEQESVDAEAIRINKMLKVIKLSETSDFNSTGDKYSLEYSGKSLSASATIEH